jgi:PIN domain nuclease of toxin-antitoxin system
LQTSPAEWWREAITRHGLIEIPLSAQIAIDSVALARIHNDPADRMIIATARQQNLTILTPDREFAKYPNVSVLW